MEGWFNSLSKRVTVKNKRMKWNENETKSNKLKGWEVQVERKTEKEVNGEEIYRLPINDIVSNLLASLVEIVASSLP